MNGLLALIDKTNRTLSTVAGACALVMLFCQSFSVVARYIFSYGIISVQEAVIYGHATLFLLGSAFLLQANQHVRVDIFYSQFSAKQRRWLDIVAMIFFVLPVCMVILWMSTTYVSRAWSTLEGSPQSGGIPALFLLKTGILVFAVSVGLQAVAIAIRLFHKQSNTPWNVTDSDSY